MNGVTIRATSWERKDSDTPYRVFERDDCKFLQRRIPNAPLKDVLEQAYFDLVQLGVYKVEFMTVQPKQMKF